MSRPRILHRPEHDWFNNRGFAPGGDPIVRVIYANGHKPQAPHRASWWTRWSLRGDPFDIAQYRFAEESE